MKPDNNFNCNQQQEAFASKAVHSIDSRIDIPDGEETWKKMQNKMSRITRRSRRKRLVTICAAVASLSIIVGSFSGAVNESFAYKSLFTRIKEARDGLVSILYGKQQNDPKNAKTLPPPDYAPDKANNNQADHIVQPLEMSLEQARSSADFLLRTGYTIPEGYTEYRIKVYPDADEKKRTVRMEFKNTNSEILILTQRKLIEDGTGWKSTINEASGRIKEVNINGSTGILVLFTGGGSRLQWLADDVIFDINGKLSEEDILAFADSVKLK